jgi:hypothetical protein
MNISTVEGLEKSGQVIKCSLIVFSQFKLAKQQSRYIVLPHVRFEVFTAVRMLLFLWVLAPCRLVGRSSALKMETVCFSETLASTDESTRLKNPEEHHHSLCDEENEEYRSVIAL